MTSSKLVDVLITAKGRRWEILHSLWIGWTFTLGFFNWIAFVYIGVRAKRRKWILWGVLYSVPFVVGIITPVAEEASGWTGDLWFGVLLIAWVASVIHAFAIRKEYLLRLETLQQQRDSNDTMLRRRPTEKHDADARNNSNSVPSSDAPETTTADPAEDVHPTPLKKDNNSASTSTNREARADAGGAEPSSVPNTTFSDIGSEDELEYRISTAYPFPLAFGFRSLASIVDRRDLYREQLRVAENTLAFLGSVSLAILQEQEDGKEVDIDPREFWRSGISPGDWRDIVARCSKTFASYDETSLGSAIKRLKIRSEKKGFGADVISLIRAKNDYKHDRGPVVLEDIADASEEVQKRLKRCMEALSFFTEYPIRQVEDFDVSRRGNGVVLKCLRYTGDHPSFLQEEVVYDRALPRGDLFIDLGQKSWIPLFPFMTTMTCARCKVRETYFIDMWDTRRNIASMKSFERGHVTTNKEVSEALTEWSDNR